MSYYSASNLAGIIACIADNCLKLIKETLFPVNFMVFGSLSTLLVSYYIKMQYIRALSHL